MVACKEPTHLESLPFALVIFHILVEMRFDIQHELEIHGPHVLIKENSWPKHMSHTHSAMVVPLIDKEDEILVVESLCLCICGHGNRGHLVNSSHVIRPFEPSTDFIMDRVLKSIGLLYVLFDAH